MTRRPVRQRGGGIDAPGGTLPDARARGDAAEAAGRSLLGRTGPGVASAPRGPDEPPDADTGLPFGGADGFGAGDLAGARIDFAPPVAAERAGRLLGPRAEVDARTTSLVTRICWPTRTFDCGIRFHSRSSSVETWYRLAIEYSVSPRRTVW